MYIKNRLGLIEGTETMLAHEQRMNQIANNIANADTTGYKKENITFWEMLFNAADSRPRVGKALKIIVDHQQGAAEETANPLDFAIQDKGFFKIQTPEGIRYTRNGNFTLNSQGQLSTMEGHLVMGGGGAIVLESDQVSVSQDGQISQNGQVVNQLNLVTFNDLSVLEKDQQNLFKAAGDNAQEVIVDDPKIAQGFLETANVNIVKEMTEMIDLHRAYQTQQKAIQTIDEIDAQSVTKVGKLT